MKSAGTLALLQLSVDDDRQAAEQTLLTAVQHQPTSVEAVLTLGRFYSLTGQLAAAEAQFRTAVTLEPNNGPALLELAKLQQRAGKLAETEQTLSRLSALPDKTYRSYHAEFLIQNGQKVAGIAELKQHLAADAGDKQVRTRLLRLTSRGAISTKRKPSSAAPSPEILEIRRLWNSRAGFTFAVCGSPMPRNRSLRPSASSPNPLPSTTASRRPNAIRAARSQPMKNCAVPWNWIRSFCVPASTSPRAFARRGRSGKRWKYWTPRRRHKNRRRDT